MSFEIEGLLHKKFDTEKKTESFQAREFVITLDGNYPQHIKFQLTQDRCQIVDQVNEGEKIKVFFDLRGREWQGKYFTNLNAWKIEKMAAEVDTPTFNDEPPSINSFPTQEPQGENQEDFDDLPF